MRMDNKVGSFFIIYDFNNNKTLKSSKSTETKAILPLYFYPSLKQYTAFSVSVSAIYLYLIKDL